MPTRFLVFSISLFLTSTAVLAEDASPDLKPPDLYRLPFVIPGGVLDKGLPRDREHWIPKGIGMRFGGDHFLFDPETCAVRGWWRSGGEKIQKMNWGSRVVHIPEDATQTADADGLRFEWGPRDAYGAPPRTRFLGYRQGTDGRIELRWDAGEGEGAVHVMETFRPAAATWNGVALSGVTRVVRAMSSRPPKGPAVVPARFRTAPGGPVWVSLDGAVRRADSENVASSAWKEEARTSFGTTGGGVAFACRASPGGTPGFVLFHDKEIPGAAVVGAIVTPTDPAATSVVFELSYFRLPPGVTPEQVIRSKGAK